MQVGITTSGYGKLSSNVFGARQARLYWLCYTYAHVETRDTTQRDRATSEISFFRKAIRGAPPDLSTALQLHPFQE